MPIELSTDLPTPLVPVAWLIGDWAGAGVVGYPTVEEARFGQEVRFWHDGRPFLNYTSRTWLLDDEGRQLHPLASETGYWRPVAGPPGDPDADPDAEPAAGVELEVLLVHPTGIAEIYLGTARGPRIDLSTDLVARTSTAKEYNAATRQYGLVEGDLLWVLDMAAVRQPLQAHASARLKRV